MVADEFFGAAAADHPGFAKSPTKALKDITARLPVKRRSGMPRFKKKDLADPSLNYTRRGFRLKDGRLHLAGAIVVRVVWSRELPADPSSVRIYRDSLGHWYASFCVPAQVEPLPACDRVIGVDWGVKETATTTSDAHDLPHPQRSRRWPARQPMRGSRRRRPRCWRWPVSTGGSCTWCTPPTRP